MSGIVKLAKVASSAARMTAALPELPAQGTLLVRLIRLANGATTDHFEPHFRAAGIPEGAFHVLCLLSADPEGRAAPSELAEMMGTSRANMTRLLDQMEKHGWIAREASPVDGRRQVVSLKDKGRAQAEATSAGLGDEIEAGFGALAHSERDQLELLLRKLVLSMDPAVRAGLVAV